MYFLLMKLLIHEILDRILIKLNLSSPDKVSLILEEDIWQAVLAANQQIDR